MNSKSNEVSTWQGSSLVNLLQEIANNWSGACPRTYAVMLTDLLDSNGLPPVKFSETFFSIASRPQAQSTTGSPSSTKARALETSAATGAKILETTAASAARSLEKTSAAVTRTVEDATAVATRCLETSVTTMIKSLGCALIALENATSNITSKVTVTDLPPQYVEEEEDNDTDVVDTSCIPPTSGEALKNKKLGNLFRNLGAKPFTKPVPKKVLDQVKDLPASKGCDTGKPLPSIPIPPKGYKLHVKARSGSNSSSDDDDSIFPKPISGNAKKNLSTEQDVKKKHSSGRHSRNHVRKNSKSSDFLSQSIFMGTKTENPITKETKVFGPSNNKPSDLVSKAGTSKQTYTTPSKPLRLKMAGSCTPLTIKSKLKVVGLLAEAKGTPLSTKTVTRANARHNPKLKRLQKSKRPMLNLESPGMFSPTNK